MNKLQGSFVCHRSYLLGMLPPWSRIGVSPNHCAEITATVSLLGGRVRGFKSSTCPCYLREIGSSLLLCYKLLICSLTFNCYCESQFSLHFCTVTAILLCMQHNCCPSMSLGTVAYCVYSHQMWTQHVASAAGLQHAVTIEPVFI